MSATSKGCGWPDGWEGGGRPGWSTTSSSKASGAPSLTSRCSLTSGTRARRNSYFGLKSRQRLLIVVCQAGGWPRPLGLEGIEAIMFRTIGDRPSPWASLLPPGVLRLPGELARADALLDDPAFFAPFAPHFHPVLGLPSTPAGG